MHPNAYLSTFWRLELKPQIFVAMSFSRDYQVRFDQVIAPAIESIAVRGVTLKPFRVDISKSGDSILTDIMEGIAHSQMILADVSAIGRDSKTSHSYRNGNVMYEVGIALACRQSEEVLLVRDDEEKFLFDVSTVPHMKIDFTDVTNARRALTEQLMDRLRAQSYVRDARVEKALRALSPAELFVLKDAAKYGELQSWGWPKTVGIDISQMAALPRLLDKQMIRVAGMFEEGQPAYQFTPLGHLIAQIAVTGLPRIKAETEITAPVPDPPSISPASQ